MSNTRVSVISEFPCLWRLRSDTLFFWLQSKPMVWFFLTICMYFKSVLSLKWFAGLLGFFFLLCSRKWAGSVCSTPVAFEASVGGAGWRRAVALRDTGTSSRLHVRGSFCSRKVPSSSGLAETQQYWVFCCQGNVKYKQLLCGGAPVMPVTPNLAWPRQETSYRGDRWRQGSAVDWEQPAKCPSEESEPSLSIGVMQKYKKTEAWGVCSKMVQKRTGRLCVSGGPGQKRRGGGSLALAPFSERLPIPFRVHWPLPHPSLKKTQKCKTIIPASAWLWPCICVMLVKSYSSFKMFV